MIKLYPNYPNTTYTTLETAFNIGYNTDLNNLYKASFSMPLNDPKTQLIHPFSIVEIFDANKRVELFRVVPNKIEINETSDTVSYELEHVVATLIDSFLFLYHEFNNQSTRDILQYIIDHQDEIKWVLDQVDFNYYFSHKFENENLLAAMFSIPKTFTEQYKWTYDTTVYPWRINLINNTQTLPKTRVRYAHNQIAITRNEDPTVVVTKLYGAGYGEGINTLTAAPANGGVPYIMSGTQGQYGIISRLFIDKKEEDPATLLAKMQAYIERAKYPRVSYEIQAAHLYQITNNAYDDFNVGDLCQVIDTKNNLTFTLPIVSVSKSDVMGDPGNATITLANTPEDLAKDIADIANRQRINEVYSQGATNLLSSNFADNCDSSNPAVMRFYVPEETVRVNKLYLYYKTSAFRAYSKALTSEEEQTLTSMGGGASILSSDDGGAITTTSEGGGEIDITSGTGKWQLLPPNGIPADFMNPSPEHDHTFWFWTQSNGWEEGYTSMGGEHAHSMFSVEHYHDLYQDMHSHGIILPDHYHEIEIPEHTHDVTIPEHTHDIEYGIHLAYSLTPSSLIVKIDGVVTGITDLNADKLDIVQYLSRDSNGRITRGTFHTIELLPAEPDKLARIEADAYMQIFIQSRGGGDF